LLKNIQFYQVKFKILQTISTYSLDKQLDVQDFLERFNVSNKKQTQLKQMTRLRKSVVTIFEDAQDLKLIEPRFTLLMKTNKTEEVEKLRSNLLVKAKSVFYTEIP
jgi:hypothetical protein